MKSKDPDFKIPVGKDQFRCYKCDGVVNNDNGGWNEVEPGLSFKHCADCYKPKKDIKHSEDEIEVVSPVLEQVEEIKLSPTAYEEAEAEK